MLESAYPELEQLAKEQGKKWRENPDSLFARRHQQALRTPEADIPPRRLRDDED